VCLSSVMGVRSCGIALVWVSSSCEVLIAHWYVGLLDNVVTDRMGLTCSFQLNHLTHCIAQTLL
jgi:hypothetical protein